MMMKIDQEKFRSEIVKMFEKVEKEMNNIITGNWINSDLVEWSKLNLVRYYRLEFLRRFVMDESINKFYEIIDKYLDILYEYIYEDGNKENLIKTVEKLQFEVENLKKEVLK